MYLKNKCTQTEMMVFILNRKVIDRIEGQGSGSRTTLEKQSSWRGDTPKVSPGSWGTPRPGTAFRTHRPGFCGATVRSHPRTQRGSARVSRPARNYGSQKAVRVEEGRAEAAGRALEATVLGVPSVVCPAAPAVRTENAAPRSPLSPGRWPGPAGASARRTGRGGM